MQWGNNGLHMEIKPWEAHRMIDGVAFSICGVNREDMYGHLWVWNIRKIIQPPHWLRSNQINSSRSSYFSFDEIAPVNTCIWIPCFSQNDNRSGNDSFVGMSEVMEDERDTERARDISPNQSKEGDGSLLQEVDRGMVAGSSLKQMLPPAQACWNYLPRPLNSSMWGYELVCKLLATCAITKWFDNVKKDESDSIWRRG